MDSQRARLVFVTRKSLLELLVERHGTLAQAGFYLRSRGQELEPYQEADRRLRAGLGEVLAAIPADRRRTRIDRGDLDRFLFAPDDQVVVVGQDGLVANVAKYLRGQLTVGVNPDPERYDGVLCRHRPSALSGLLRWLERAADPSFQIERRAMALAEREDGQQLLALNEVFVGHRTHQSARYRLRAAGREERQSSSGLIVATGTGSTGWARSIARQRGLEEVLPAPMEQRLAWFVREPFPSVSTGVELDAGLLGPGDRLEIFSEMGEDGVVFADGIETDRLDFLDGQSVRLSLSGQVLNLVVPCVASASTGARTAPDQTSRHQTSRPAN